AAGATQADVEQHGVRRLLLDGPHRVGRFAALADDLHLPGIGAEHGLQPIEHHLVVIDDHQPHRRGAGAVHVRNGTHGWPITLLIHAAAGLRPEPRAGATAATAARWPGPRS